MDIANRDNARRLIGAAAGIGVAITWNRAADLLNNFGSIARALAHLRRRLAAEREYVQWQIRQGEEAARQREEARMEIDMPRRQTELTHNPAPRGSDIVLQERPGLTRDYLRCGYKKGKKSQLGPKYAVRKGVFKIKRLNGYDQLQLSTALSHATVDATYVGLPMYCINLSALAWQGQGTTNVGSYNTIPMYRLVRTEADLTTGTANYTWLRQECHVDQTAQPTSNTEGWQFCWNRKNTDGYPTATPYYQHHWSNIKLLFQCSEDCDCIVHTDIVQFPEEHVAPRRQYWEVGDGTSNVVTYMDNGADNAERAPIDVFWESFWARRIIHPLSEYQNPDKSKYIKFLHKGSLRINQSTNSMDQNQRHMRSIFWNDGKIYNLRDSAVYDKNTQGTLNAQNLVNNPVTRLADDYNRTNQVESNTNVLPYNRDRRLDTYLLIYADMLQRPKPTITPVPCTFDFQIDNKYSWIDAGVAIPTSGFLNGGAAPVLANP